MNDLAAFLRARYDEDEGRALAWRTPGNSFFSPELAARVLREVEAKRKILDAYAPVAKNDGYMGGGEPEYAFGWAEGLGVAVRALAAVYSDHPDYQKDS